MAGSNHVAAALLATALINTMSANSQAQEKRCPGLRALNGECTRVAAVEDATSRAMIMTTVRSSYFGTPIGTFGGQYIPYERLFRDNPLLFGLPTYTFLNTSTFIILPGDPGGFLPGIYTSTTPVRTK